jgi:hypothetical protein
MKNLKCWIITIVIKISFLQIQFSIIPTNSPRLGVLGVFGKLLKRKALQIGSILLGLNDMF